MLVMKTTVAHAQFKKREKTKMADGKIVVESKQIVLRIHERLKKEIHKMVETKSWSAEQKREFEKKLLEVSFIPYDHHKDFHLNFKAKLKFYILLNQAHITSC